MDKEPRTLKRWKERQLTVARTRFPLPEDLLDDLFAAVTAVLEIVPCDHTLMLTRGWIAAHNVAAQPLIQWLEDHGGFCDCEVAMNAAHHFEELRTPR